MRANIVQVVLILFPFVSLKHLSRQEKRRGLESLDYIIVTVQIPAELTEHISEIKASSVHKISGKWCEGQCVRHWEWHYRVRISEGDETIKVGGRPCLLCARQGSCES